VRGARLAMGQGPIVAIDERAEDAGLGFRYVFTSYQDHEKVGIIEWHPGCTDEGGSVLFDLPIIREHFPERPRWTVERWEPLTLSPSILCKVCGWHGWLRDGRWVPA